MPRWRPGTTATRQGVDRLQFWRTKPVERILAEESGGPYRLRRTLGPLDLTALGIGAIIGAGIFVLTGVAASGYAGPGVILSFALSGLASGLAALVYAELASMVPVAGSAYTYAYASLGELVAWLVGWNIILEYVVAGGAVAIGWSSYLQDLLASAGIFLPPALAKGPGAGGVVNLPAVLIVALLTLLIITGTQHSAVANKAVVALKVGVILLFLVVGARHVDPAHWRPFLPYGVSGVVHGAAIVFFAYIGFDAVATAAEEVRNPRRDLAIGIIGSLAVSTLLYVAVAAVVTGLVPYTALNTASPVAAALLSAGIRWASALVAVGALAGLTSVLLVTMYGQSRVFFAMARDGLLPPVFYWVHPRYRTPVLDSLVIGSLVALIAGFLSIGTAAELANIGTLSAFVAVSVGVLVLRYRRPELPRPFRAPFMPWTAVLAAGFSVYLMLNLPSLTWWRFLVWVALGLVIYFAYGYRHSALNPAPGPDLPPRRLKPALPVFKKLRRPGGP
ncbi:MAG: amino acid permease [Desulfotomaculales bacterium]